MSAAPELLLPPAHAAALISSFTSFLTIAVHSLLSHRGLYPPATFLLARAYNIPVRQSRHPAVCAWVRDAAAAVAVQIRARVARRVAFSVHAPSRARTVVERWVFDLRDFPTDPRLADEPVTNDTSVFEADEIHPQPVNWTDVHESLRAALRKLAHSAESLAPPPDDCTFTLAVELRDHAPAPIQHPQVWIPSEPHQPPTASHPDHGTTLGGVSTVPIRSVQAGPLFFECWVEQGACNAPDKANDGQPT